jgi:hypothetical protein
LYLQMRRLLLLRLLSGSRVLLLMSRQGLMNGLRMRDWETARVLWEMRNRLSWLPLSHSLKMMMLLLMLLMLRLLMVVLLGMLAVQWLGVE